MAKITIYALHGNGGSPEDWNALQSKFPIAQYDWKNIDTYSNKWIEEIEKEKTKVYIVAHSWGCYRFLKVAKRLLHHVEKVFLINPYLEQETPVSPVARAALGLPILGKKLISSNHQKSYGDFLAKMISPASIEGLKPAQEAKSRLSNLTLWQKALDGKLLQQNLPLDSQDICTIPGFAFFGGKDQVMNVDRQQKALRPYLYVHQKLIADGGHALLWTHMDQIEKEIKLHTEKIGYFAGSQERNNVISFMEKHVMEHAGKIALRWADPQSLKTWDGNPYNRIQHQEINFKDMEERIARFAQGLQSIGLQKGDRVIIFLPMSLDMYVAMFAVQRIGAIAVFLDSWARSHHLGASAECVEPKAMISFNMAFQLVDQVPEFSTMPIRIMYGPGDKMTHKFEDLLKQPRSQIASVESEFTALITFTTGSTGKPKGANRTHRFLSAQHHALSHVIPYTEYDVDMPAFPIFSLNSLATGVTTLLPAVNLAEPSPKDAALLACQILHENVNCTTLSPSMLVGLANFCAEKGILLKNLRRVVTGGAPISKDDVEAFYKIAPQTELWILYGSTEAEPMAHIEGRDMIGESKMKDSETVESGVNVGEISEDIDYKFIKIKNEPIDLKTTSWSSLEVNPGQVGEFICTGDHVCRDYYNNPEAFKSTKIMGEDGRVWHRTGDLAYIDSKKNLWIVGRTNNAIERKGEYFFPVQAEVLLKRLSFTSRCAFLGMPDASLGQATHAVIELKSEIDPAAFDFTAARKEVQRIFEKNKVPLDQIQFVKKVPMDPRHHSKVEYAVLRKILQESPDEILGGSR